jgi:excinuclease ABC subunit C
MILKDNPKELKQILKMLPDSPGVYMYSNENGEIIYIGKAKSLKKRVQQYFNKDITGKTKVLVSKISTIRTIVVNTELDALLLENNLIKEHQPRYNIMLKDDKTYPWLCIKNEPFPRIVKTRKKINDGSEYFGPYAYVRMLNTILETIEKIYPLRTCRYQLTEKNIKNKKFNVCLKYHIKKCAGPCVGLQSKEDYDENIKQIRSIIMGHISPVKNIMEEKMMKFAKDLKFEEAQEIKEKIEVLKNYQSKSTVLSKNNLNLDVFSLTLQNNFYFVNYMKVVEGALIHVHTIEIKNVMDETEDYILTMIIPEMRSKYFSDANEVIVPFLPSIQIDNVKYTVPKIGEKKQLLELSERNLKFFILEREKKKNLVDPEKNTKRILQKMQKDLKMNTEPRRIECFDNSNLQGTDAVAAMVCFINAKPAKKEYRHYNIKTVEGPDDYASMEEVIYRRYSRVLKENLEMPQLIVIDGGKGQLNAAVKSLKKLDLYGKVTIISIAERLEEIYFPEDSIPLYIDKNSETLKVIQQIRDEAHRFGINHHRNKRSKRMIGGKK